MPCRGRALPVLLLALAALLPAILLAGSAGATQPRSDYWVHFVSRGEPEPGVPFELMATARADLGGRIDVRLSVPDGVRIDGSPYWQAEIGAGETLQRVWTLVATEEGLWSARLLEGGDDAGERTRACCLYARTYEGRSAAGGSPLDALEPMRVDHSLRADAVDAETVRLTYSVTSGSPWTSDLRLVLAFSTQPGPHPFVFDPGEPAVASTQVALADGDQVTVPLLARGVAFFDTVGGPLEDFGGDGVPLRCVRAVLERSGDDVNWTSSEPCHGTVTPSEADPSSWRRVPAPAALPALVVAAVGAAVLARGVRR